MIATGASTKLQAKFKGPYVITRKLPNDTYQVKYLNETKRKSFVTKVHISDLKLWRRKNSEDEDEESEDNDEAVGDKNESIVGIETENIKENEKKNEYEVESEKLRERGERQRRKSQRYGQDLSE